MKTIVVEKIKVSSSFKYLWLKYVNNVNLDVHCAKSLIGEYSKKITTKQGEFYNIALDESDYKAIYLCGVSYPYVWENNFHLAFKYSEGKTLYYNSNGIEIILKNAVRLPIDIKYVDFSHPKAKFKSYHTCRNWQFAHWFYKNMI